MPTHEHPVSAIQESLQKKLTEIYWAAALRNFAIGLVGVFEPVYLFLYFQNSFAKTFLFYGLLALGHLLLTPLMIRSVSVLGIKKSMALGTPLAAAYLLLLLAAPHYGTGAITAALVVHIIYTTLFWPSYHIEFAKSASRHKIGRQISSINAIAALVKAAAPFIGGFVLVLTNFPTLFSIAAVLMVLSAVPLLLLPETYEHYSLTYRGSFTRILQRACRRSSLAFFFEGVETIAAVVIFPLFIYMVIPNFEVIGWVTSLSLVFVIVFTYLIGWITDKKGDRRVIAYASITNAFAWIINAFIVTPLHYAVFGSFLRFSETANHLPFIAMIYKRANELGHDVDEYVVYHELAHNAGKVAMMAVCVAGFWYGWTSFLWYFAIPATAALFFRLAK